MTRMTRRAEVVAEPVERRRGVGDEPGRLVAVDRLAGRGPAERAWPAAAAWRRRCRARRRRPGRSPAPRAGAARRSPARRGGPAGAVAGRPSGSSARRASPPDDSTRARSGGASSTPAARLASNQCRVSWRRPRNHHGRITDADELQRAGRVVLDGVAERGADVVVLVVEAVQPRAAGRGRATSRSTRSASSMHQRR